MTMPCEALIKKQGTCNDYLEREYSVGEIPIGEAPLSENNSDEEIV